MDDVDLDANMIANAKKNYAHAWKCYRCSETKIRQHFIAGPMHSAIRQIHTTIANACQRQPWRMAVRVFAILHMCMYRSSGAFVVKVHGKFLHIFFDAFCAHWHDDRLERCLWRLFLIHATCLRWTVRNFLPKTGSAIGIDLNLKNFIWIPMDAVWIILCISSEQSEE